VYVMYPAPERAFTNPVKICVNCGRLRVGVVDDVVVVGEGVNCTAFVLLQFDTAIAFAGPQNSTGLHPGS
jgi:hypothetical protein